jgi:tripartite-type tricarboxylate transporter receptor subunit TctC
MSRIGRRDALKLALATPFVLTGHRVLGQTTWPAKAVSITLPFAPGGAGDIMTRVMFQKVSDILKQPMIIENRSAGASVQATSYVNSLPKDGYAFLMIGIQQIVVPVLLKDLPFDYRTTFVPVTQMCNYAQCFTVQMDSPIKTLADLVAAGKANPGKLRCGTSAAGGMPHLAMEEFQHRAGIKFVHIPYRVAVEGPRDLANGQIDCLVLTVSTLSPMLQAKKVRIIAVSTPERSKAVPEIPTVAESGFPGYEMGDWGGLFAVKGTPEPIMKQMQEAVAMAAKDKGVLDTLLPQGTEPVGSTAEEFSKFFERQTTLLTRVVKEAGVTLG